MDSSSSQVSSGPRFRDVIGLFEAKRALREALLLPTLFSPKDLTGVRSVSSCVLLYGPPGTGKTVLAEAAAYESHRPIFRVSPASILSRFIGESEKALAQVFIDASQTSPCGLIFFDEIDALAPRRDGGSGDVDIAARRLLNELLLLLSSMPIRFPNVFVVAATNRCQDIDAALLRRFSVCIYCAPPTFKDRKYLIKSLLRDIESDISNEDLGRISSLTEGWTGSDLKGLAVEAAMAPLRDALSGGKRKRTSSWDDQTIDHDSNDDEDDEDENEAAWLPSSWVKHSTQEEEEGGEKGGEKGGERRVYQKIRAVTVLDFDAAFHVCFPASLHHQNQSQSQNQNQNQSNLEINTDDSYIYSDPSTFAEATTDETFSLTTSTGRPPII
jgi:SpoVK/Ycf46/Vps4 family AAA+-type ATPase